MMRRLTHVPSASSPRSRGLMAMLPALVLAALLVACGSDDDDGSGAAIVERWLRLGEDSQTSIFIYEHALPPNLVDLLNPRATPDTPDDELIALPVHPEGELVGSYVMRRPDGAHLVWLIYDARLPEGEIAPVVQEQLDETPWQVTGAQADPSLSVVRFQSTMTGDFDGTAFVQPNPAAVPFNLTVDRDGSEVVLEVASGAYVPLIEAAIASDLEVTRVDPGSARLAGLRQGDRIVAVEDTSVSTRRDLTAALEDLGRSSEASTAITYILSIEPFGAADDRVFIVPPGRTLPDRFPALAVWDAFTVLDYAWVSVPGGRAYRAGMVTLDSPTDTVDTLRNSLQAGGWEIVADRPQGFATVLDFVHEGEGLAGSAEIDLFPPDEAYTLVLVEFQTTP